MDAVNSISGLSVPAVRAKSPRAFDAAATSADALQLARQEEFAGVLNRAREEKPVDLASMTEDERLAAARETAQDFVAIAFVTPILKQFRESSTAAPPFAPTSGEKQFRSLADAQTARQIVRASNFPIVDRIAEGLARVTGRVQAGSPADVRRHASNSVGSSTAEGEPPPHPLPRGGGEEKKPASQPLPRELETGAEPTEIHA